MMSSDWISLISFFTKWFELWTEVSKYILPFLWDWTRAKPLKHISETLNSFCAPRNFFCCLYQNEGFVWASPWFVCHFVCQILQWSFYWVQNLYKWRDSGAEEQCLHALARQSYKTSGRGFSSELKKSRPRISSSTDLFAVYFQRRFPGAAVLPALLFVSACWLLACLPQSFFSLARRRDAAILGLCKNYYSRVGCSMSEGRECCCYVGFPQ